MPDRRKRRRYYSHRRLDPELSTGRSGVSYPRNFEENNKNAEQNAPPRIQLNASHIDEAHQSPDSFRAPEASSISPSTTPVEQLEPHFFQPNNDEIQPESPTRQVEGSAMDAAALALSELEAVLVERGDVDEAEEEEYIEVQEHQLPLLEVDVTATAHDSQTDSIDAIMRRSQAGLQKAVQVLLGGLNMVTVSVLVGTGRMSVIDYKSTRRLVNILNKTRYARTERMPSYDTMLRKLYPALFAFAFAPHDVVSVDVNVRASGVSWKKRRISQAGEVPKSPLLIVKPSSWLVRDAHELLTWLEKSHVTLKYAEMCSYINTLLEQFPGIMSRDCLFSEMRFHHETWHVGRHIRPGDIISVECIVRNQDLL